MIGKTKQKWHRPLAAAAAAAVLQEWNGEWFISLLKKKRVYSTHHHRRQALRLETLGKQQDILWTLTKTLLCQCCPSATHRLQFTYIHAYMNTFKQNKLENFGTRNTRSSSWETERTASQWLEWKSVTWILRCAGSAAVPWTWNRNCRGGVKALAGPSTLGCPNMGFKSTSNPSIFLASNPPSQAHPYQFALVASKIWPRRVDWQL